MTWLDALGWGGSALLIFSLLQARVLRFRVLNFIACLVLVVFNAVLMIWPMVAMNVVLAGINLWFIVRLLRERDDEAAFEVLATGADDAYLRHFLRVHRAELARFQPDFEPAAISRPGAGTYLVQRGTETVGVVVVQQEGEVGHVLLDYVTPRYRDFSPGRFVWRDSGLLAGRGICRVVTSPTMVEPYYDRLGFRAEGRSWVLDLPQTGQST